VKDFISALKLIDRATSDNVTPWSEMLNQMREGMSATLLEKAEIMAALEEIMENIELDK
jgi:hypothetical protein